jgi:hypothetical protein
MKCEDLSWVHNKCDDTPVLEPFMSSMSVHR